MMCLTGGVFLSPGLLASWRGTAESQLLETHSFLAFRDQLQFAFGKPLDCSFVYGKVVSPSYTLLITFVEI